MLNPKHPLAELLRRDTRYHFDAYTFVFDALRYGQEKLGYGTPEGEALQRDEEDDDPELERHVTGQELCLAIRRYAIEQYGLMARVVLRSWGVNSTSDFGEIVFNLIDIGQMRKTDNDRREDFDNVFDFEDALNERAVFAMAGREDASDEDHV